jgi:DNA-binding MarR family transcriptional regulator
MAQIDAQLRDLDRRLEGYDELAEQRRRLMAARAALSGDTPGEKRLTQDEVAEYVRAHPGSKAGEIAQGLGVTQGMVSAHLFRGRDKRFVRRDDGWHLK